MKFQSILILLIIATTNAINILNEYDDELSTHVSSEDFTQTLSFFIERIAKNFDKKSFNFEKMRNNSFIDKNLRFIKRGLKNLRFTALNEQDKKALFINIYNILALESLSLLPTLPESMNSLPEFEYQNGYRIGDKVYHLAAIKHGVLRDNSADVKTGQAYLNEEEKKHISIKKDPRIFAALFQPSESSPPLMSFSAASLEDTLNKATHLMCNKGVLLDGDDSNIAINTMFKDYLNDFATSEDNLLRWLSKCVEDTDKRIALYFAAVDKSFFTYSFKNFENKIPVMVEPRTELKLNVDVYIESLCSDTHEFFQDQLLPSYQDLKKIINLNIVSFGKATVTPLNNGKDIEFECQNGPLECLGNKIMSCVVEYFPVDIQVPFLACLMATPSIPRAIKECGRKNNVPVATIEECYTSSEGSLILYENGLETLKLDPELYFVPTIAVNKKYNSSTIQMSTKNFSSFICKSFLESFEGNQGIFTPSGCKVKLDVFIESLNPNVHKFFTDQLTPTWLRVGDSIDLKIITYGNTSITNNEGKEIASRMKCSLGPFECYGNIVMSCIVKLLPVTTHIRVLSCMMKKKMPAVNGKECVESEGKEWKPINACAEEEMGSNLILENKIKTEALSSNLNSIPTVTVNKVHNATFTEWALHDLTALVCDAFIVSKREEGRISLPKGCPVRVEIYLESLCPDTKRFFLKVFYPSFKKLRSLIDLHLIPFGKANVWLTNDGKDYNFECQHGPLECQGNKIMSCIVEYLPIDLQVELIACMMQKHSPSNAGKQCAEELKISWTPLERCYTTSEGSEFLFQNGVRTMSLKPDFYFVPTITINKFYDSKQLEISLNDIEDLVCAAYQKPFKHETKILSPKGCKLKIDLYFISFSKESKSFIQGQLIPTWKLLHKEINLKLFPIGKAPIDTFENKIELEETCRKDTNCEFDLIFVCVVKHFNIEHQLNFIDCSLNANNSVTAAKKCSQRLGLSWNTISNCFRNSESINELEKNLQKTRSLRPTFHSIPTVLINGHYNKHELQKSRFELQNMICGSFYDPASLDEWKPQGCPITLEVFMSSLCPESKRFFLHQVRPTWKSLNSILDLKIVPFGKASAKILNPESEEYEFQCQHGPLECYGNKAMSCIVNSYSINDQVRMISCMLTREYPAVEGRECADELGLNWQPIIDCIDTKGSFFLYQNGIKTQNVKPKIFYMPTAIVNGHYNKVTLRKSLRNLSGAVCSTYLKKMDSNLKAEIPNGCKVTVKIFFHSLNDEMKNFFSEAEEFWRIFKRIVIIKFLPLKYLTDKELVEDCSKNKCYKTKVLGCFMETHVTDIQMEYLACLMSRENLEHDFKICSSDLKLNFDDLHRCATSAKSSQILEDNQENFLKLQNPAKVFPFITVAKSVVHNYNDLRKFTCQNYSGPTPPECEGINANGSGTNRN